MLADPIDGSLLESKANQAFVMRAVNMTRLGPLYALKTTELHRIIVMMFPVLTLKATEKERKGQMKS